MRHSMSHHHYTAQICAQTRYKRRAFEINLHTHTKRHAESHIAPTLRATNLIAIIRAIYLYSINAPVNIGI